jgi:hypothetical protein
MEPAFFYQTIKTACEKPPHERHNTLLHLHQRALSDYLAALGRITPESAQEIVSVGEDVRTLQQIVGHMGEWARYELLGGADILAGVKNPRGVVGLERYLTPTGRIKEFDSVDEVNAYYAEVHAKWTWQHTYDFAVSTANALYALFATPHLLTADRLETTHEHLRTVENEVITGIKQGWVLWIMEIEHLAVDHRTELNLP